MGEPEGEGEYAWDEDSFVSDYGAPLPLDATGTPFDALGSAAEAQLERALDGLGSGSDGEDVREVGVEGEEDEGEDSELDLHTPLP